MSEEHQAPQIHDSSEDKSGTVITSVPHSAEHPVSNTGVEVRGHSSRTRGHSRGQIPQEKKKKRKKGQQRRINLHQPPHH